MTATQTYHVVIIDDDPEFGRMMAENLRHDTPRDGQFAFKTFLATSLADFEAMMEAGHLDRIDLVLVDDNFSMLERGEARSDNIAHEGSQHILPRLQGLRALDPDFSAMRYVLISGHVSGTNDPALIQAADRAGADGFWAKDGLGGRGVLVAKVLDLMRRDRT